MLTPVFKTKNIRAQSTTMARITIILGREFWLTNKEANAIQCIALSLSTALAPLALLLLLGK